MLARNSAQSWNRSAGSFAIALRMASANFGEISGFFLRGSGVETLTCCSLTSKSVSPSKGTLPVSISYSTMPSIDVRAPIHLPLMHDLLGAHVPRGPDGEPRRGQRLFRATRNDRDTEIHDARPPALVHQHIRRLDVSMHEPVGVGEPHPFEDVAEDGQRL